MSVLGIDITDHLIRAVNAGVNRVAIPQVTLILVVPELNRRVTVSSRASPVIVAVERDSVDSELVQELVVAVGIPLHVHVCVIAIAVIGSSQSGNEGSEKDSLLHFE